MQSRNITSVNRILTGSYRPELVRNDYTDRDLLPYNCYFTVVNARYVNLDTKCHLIYFQPLNVIYGHDNFIFQITL